MEPINAHDPHYARDDKASAADQMMMVPVKPLVTTDEERKTWYKDTLNLPKTDFPMMPPQPAERRAREAAVLGEWESSGHYRRLRELRAGRPAFVLHDGPPYANGDIHAGHAVNKVLKDIVVRYKTLRGFDAPSVPGWDCHGLPIEQAVEKESRGRTWADAADFRHQCGTKALHWVSEQARQFGELGVNADFSSPYLTMNHSYEEATLNVLAGLVERDAVYRAKKPVLWCTKHRTALAEAEVEYQEVADKSAYALYPAAQVPSGLARSLSEFPLAAEGDYPWKNFAGDGCYPLYLMVWTTTPWTLPANQAVAVNPDADYVCVWMIHNNNCVRVIVAAEAVNRVLEGGPKVASEPFKGSRLLDLKYRETFTMKWCPVLPADFVTTDAGTGIVHIAPGHGPVDYELGKKHGLETACPVGEDGRYDGATPGLDGMTVLGEGGETVLGTLRAAGLLYETETIRHSYPHCWRCRNKVIFRATDQWFVKADLGSPINTAATLNARDVDWIPEWGQSRFEGMMRTRPDWCISRQRLWGIPIPYFVNEKTGEVLMTEAVVLCVARHFGVYGSDSWYTNSPERILKGSGIDATDLRKGTDILDVWFESGASWNAVMGEDNAWNLRGPADLLIEGSDQHRGWFQSSMLLSAYKGVAHGPPAWSIITHGFVLDKDGRKMSKEMGNVYKVSDMVARYGTDITRIWVASVDYTDDMVCSDELFRNSTEAYRKIRNTIRYLLSNLYDYGGEGVAGGDTDLDSYMLWRLYGVRKAVLDAYDAYDFKTALKTIYEFLNNEVSALYAKAVKDRLYCEWANSSERESAQEVCLHILRESLQMIAPICPVMADEAWQHLCRLPCGPKGDATASVHFTEFGAVPPRGEYYEGGWTELVKLIPDALHRLDELKKEVGLTNPLDAEVVLVIPKGEGWSQYGRDFEDALGVGCHSFRYGDKLSTEVIDRRGVYARCERSRKRRPDVGEVPQFPDLSKRDARVVGGLMMSDGW